MDNGREHVYLVRILLFFWSFATTGKPRCGFNGFEPQAIFAESASAQSFGLAVLSVQSVAALYIQIVVRSVELILQHVVAVNEN